MHLTNSLRPYASLSGAVEASYMDRFVVVDCIKLWLWLYSIDTFLLHQMNNTLASCSV